MMFCTHMATVGVKGLTANYQQMTRFDTHSECNKDFFVSNWHSNSLTILDTWYTSSHCQRLHSSLTIN